MENSIIQKATTILIPSGRDYDGCVGVLEREFLLQVPSFQHRALVAYQNGKRFIKVKGRDIPMLVREGYADMGVIYTDICQEKIDDNSGLTYKILDSPHLRFCLLLPRERYEELRARIKSHDGPPVTIATLYPTVLQKCIDKRIADEGVCNVAMSPIQPSGSVEAMAALGVADVVADVVNTGETAEANDLIVYPLVDIFPALVYLRNPSS